MARGFCIANGIESRFESRLRADRAAGIRAPRARAKPESASCGRAETMPVTRSGAGAEGMSDSESDEEEEEVPVPAEVPSSDEDAEPPPEEPKLVDAKAASPNTASPAKQEETTPIGCILIVVQLLLAAVLLFVIVWQVNMLLVEVKYVKKTPDFIKNVRQAVP